MDWKLEKIIAVLENAINELNKIDPLPAMPLLVMQGSILGGSFLDFASHCKIFAISENNRLKGINEATDLEIN